MVTDDRRLPSSEGVDMLLSNVERVVAPAAVSVPDLSGSKP